jgi:hypothetical protein
VNNSTTALFASSGSSTLAHVAVHDRLVGGWAADGVGGAPEGSGRTALVSRRYAHLRRLLVHRHELLKLREAVELQGCALPALRLYWKKHHVKVEIGMAKGKKAPDKREDLKRQVAEREAARTAAAFNRRG